MKIVNTSRFGDVEVEESRIISFSKPILGFDQLNQYFLIDHSEDSPFKWLQAIDDGSVAFIVTTPTQFGIDFQFTLSEEDIKILDIKTVEEILVLVIVNIPAGRPELMTANLAGPIVLNTTNVMAMQIVLSDSNLSTKHRLISKELVKSGNEGHDNK